MADSATANEPVANLIINAEELRNSLKLIRRRGPKKDFNASLTFTEGKFTMQAGGVSADATARGYWPGTAILPVVCLHALSISDDLKEIAFSVTDSRLKIGAMTISCQWEWRSSQVVVIPLKATQRHLLRIARDNSRMAIMRAGGDEAVNVAIQARDHALDWSARVLKKWGVTREELADLVEKHLDD